MELYDAIWTRKATRQYDMTPLSQEALSGIAQFANSLRPLDAGIATACEIMDSIKGGMTVKAPHYLIVSSEQKAGYLENAGFMYQQMDLYLSGLGLGSCWLGMAKPPAALKSGLPFAITLAFGGTVGSPHRSPSEFKRKPLSEMSCGTDERLEAVRVAPSAVNAQAWFFEAEDGRIDAYQKHTLLSRVLGADLHRLDMGIALCHLYLATEHAGGTFSFVRQDAREKKGYTYIGTAL